MSKFLRGTIILLIAGFITRALGFINRIVIARSLGEEGVGLHQMAFPTLMLVVTVTQLGLPVAISKCVAEADAVGDRYKIKKILVMSLFITISLSVIFTPSLIIFAPYLADLLFTDSRVYYPLVAITPIIPIVAVSAVLRGYFQGKQNMKPFAISQVVEQTVRILFIAILAHLLLPYGIEFATAGVMVASILGELVSLFYMFTVFKIKKTIPIRKNYFKSLKAGKDVLKELMSVAIPTTGSRLIGNISWFLEPIVVAHSLALAGIADHIATKQYGSLTGFALPLLMLPSFVTFSLSTALVPAVSEAYSKRNFGLVEHRLQQAIRFSLLTSGISVIILYIFAEPLMSLMYGTSNGSQFLRIMAPFFIFQSLQAPLQATLQALDLAKAAMINSMIGAVVKLSVIFVLASQPQFGINGAAIGIMTSTVLVALLHFASVMKVIQFTLYVRDWIKLTIVTLLSGFAGYYIFKTCFLQEPFIMRLLIGIVITSIIYLVLLICTKLIHRSDLHHIPIVNKFL
ncbi:stage V sporulation protein B [Heyndrickxia ginsengihumi]|uniref:Stage V sporulation protein B n=1 Tax=Heyndrickxia ginsengihumi TaxID=363870 RepID=A0A0A6Y3P1_9BACI|nr:stage V sporulation protein B [Heyndrickxia ginsengihumi]KHD86857.1 stage V sporulation protein B [Heyndrickxia ginsengihumi]MBE6184810.1 stage V sporulation protein B [Bacillus sp. (in: firmicutes)]MCM3021857.1 stage V sporulation protein B [Heyndrickxia ginsengihumi]NEY20456.1 stage V sporulation protein B [Heyndrickxia ginsengihumi]